MKENNIYDVVVLIPSLDPDIQMVSYIHGLKEKGFKKIVVVDDGSKRDTQSYFEEINSLEEVTVLKHAVNQGKGRALKTGFNYILNTYSSEEIVGVVTADADGQHGVEDTAKVAECLRESGGLVLGSRDFNEDNVPFKSRNGNKITTAVFALLYGKKISDTQTGLRGIPYSFLAKCLNFFGERFEYEIVMLIEAVRSKESIIEVPIQTIYINSNRATHFHAIRDSFRIYRVIFQRFIQYTMSGLASFVIDMSLFAFYTKVLFKQLDVATATFWGTLLARVVSSFVNYSMNKTVFSDKQKMRKSVFKYYALCALQLVFSWLLVVLVFRHLQWDTTLIKGIVDTFLFFISYQVQQAWVFKER